MRAETSHVRRAIGERLRRSRLALGLTLDDVVGRVARGGVKLSRSSLHRIETGRSPQPVEVVAAVCGTVGLPLTAIEETARAARLQAPLDLTGWDAGALMARGQELGASGRIAEALQFFEAAHDRLLLEEPPQPDRDRRRVQALLHIADCLRRLRCFHLALEAAGQALALSSDRVDDRLRALTLQVSIGEMQNDDDRVDLFARHAEKLLPHAGCRAQAFALAVLANMHYRRREWDRAAPLFERAIALYERMRAELPLARVEVTSGDNLFRSGDEERGVARIHDGYHRARRCGFAAVVAYALRILGRIEARHGRYADARFHFEKAAALAGRLRLTHELFLAWFGRWQVAGEAADGEERRRARRVLERLLPHIDPTLPEARRFAAAIALERGASP